MATIKFVPQSSRIKELEYDPDTSRLVVTFQRGGVYQYENVPQEYFDSLRSAESVGRAIGYITENPELFPYERLR